MVVVVPGLSVALNANLLTSEMNLYKFQLRPQETFVRVPQTDSGNLGKSLQVLFGKRGADWETFRS